MAAGGGAPARVFAQFGERSAGRGTGALPTIEEILGGARPPAATHGAMGP